MAMFGYGIGIGGAGGAGVLQTSTGAIAVCPLATLATIFIWLTTGIRGPSVEVEHAADDLVHRGRAARDLVGEGLDGAVGAHGEARRAARDGELVACLDLHACGA